MKVVLDTNVLMSAIFFSGTPYRVLDAWRKGRIELVVSQEIIEEYRQTGQSLTRSFPGVDVAPWIELILAEASLVLAPPLPEPVCTDPDDDKFLACALAAKARVVCSGDKALLKTRGYQGIQVLTARQVLDLVDDE